MKWKVTGADAGTGHDRTMIIVADNEESASRRANRAGLMVAEVRAIDPNDSVHGMGAALPQAEIVPPAVVPGAIPAPVMAYASVGQAAGGQSTNGLGIASIATGSFTLLLAMIPCLGMLSLPVSFIALGLGVAGIIVAMVGRQMSAKLAIIGTSISFVAMILPFLMPFVWLSVVGAFGPRPMVRPPIVKATPTGSNAPASAAGTYTVQAPQASNTAPAVASASPASSTARQAGRGDSTARAAASEPTSTEITPFGTEAVMSDVTVKITNAVIGPVTVVDAKGKTKPPGFDVLAISITVHNHSPQRKINYKTFTGGDLVPNPDAIAMVIDDGGTIYRRVNFGRGDQPQGRSPNKSLMPGEELSDVLFFTAPQATASDLHLKLPGRFVSARGYYLLDLPVSQITHP